MGVGGHWLPFSCFWQSRPKAAEDGILASGLGFWPADACVDDVDEEDEPFGIAQMQTSSYEAPSELQQCRSCPNAGDTVAERGSGDDDVDEACVEEPLRERLGPGCLMQENSSERQPCACFAYCSIDRLKKECGSRKGLEGRESFPTCCAWGQSNLTKEGQPALPDDVVELCLARMSFSTLARARMVCRKWRDLTMSPHFVVSREKVLSRKPWLLVFGLSKDRAFPRGEICALDTSSNQWHSIQADILSGRFLFSVASLEGLVYVLGGRSSLSERNGKQGKSSVKTHKGVLIYNPFTCTWRKGCSMTSARAVAVTGVFEIKDQGVMQETSSCKEPGKARVSAKQAKRKGLIVVGGQGLWSQPLYSAEIYDPFTNTWSEVARLPADHGITCAGVVCNGLFYVYSETDKLAAYDFDLKVWISIQVSSSTTRLREYAPKLMSCKGKLILMGVAWGSRERSNGTPENESEAAMRMLWEFDQNSHRWQLFAKHPDAPLDSNAVFVGKRDQIYALEMFRIFGQVLDFVTVCDLSGSEAMWTRMSRMRLGNDLDVSSCATKVAVVVNL